MALEPYSCVRLRTDRFVEEGAKTGDVGFVIEVYPDGNYEVEFSDANGITYAQLVAGAEDLELCPDRG